MGKYCGISKTAEVLTFMAGSSATRGESELKVVCTLTAAASVISL